jgi:hypothetical protein
VAQVNGDLGLLEHARPAAMGVAATRIAAGEFDAQCAPGSGQATSGSSFERTTSGTGGVPIWREAANRGRHRRHQLHDVVAHLRRERRVLRPVPDNARRDQAGRL